MSNSGVWGIDQEYFDHVYGKTQPAKVDRTAERQMELFERLGKSKIRQSSDTSEGGPPAPTCFGRKNRHEENASAQNLYLNKGQR